MERVTPLEGPERERLTDVLRQALFDARPRGTYSEAFSWDDTIPLADAVLDALYREMEQVGWYRPPSDYSIHGGLEHRVGAEFHTDCVPVYRFRSEVQS